MDEYLLPLNISPEVASRLGYYVYLYIDPRSGKPFYVGKGQGQRALSHLTEEGESQKSQTLQELKEQGLAPQIDILTHALPDEETALRIEASVIDLLALMDSPMKFVAGGAFNWGACR